MRRRSCIVAVALVFSISLGCQVAAHAETIEAAPGSWFRGRRSRPPSTSSRSVAFGRRRPSNALRTLRSWRLSMPAPGAPRQSSGCWIWVCRRLPPAISVRRPGATIRPICFNRTRRNLSRFCGRSGGTLQGCGFCRGAVPDRVEAEAGRCCNPGRLCAVPAYPEAGRRGGPAARGGRSRSTRPSAALEQPRFRLCPDGPPERGVRSAARGRKEGAAGGIALRSRHTEAERGLLSAHRARIRGLA